MRCSSSARFTSAARRDLFVTTVVDTYTDQDPRNTAATYSHMVLPNLLRTPTMWTMKKRGATQIALLLVTTSCLSHHRGRDSGLLSIAGACEESRFLDNSSRGLGSFMSWLSARDGALSTSYDLRRPRLEHHDCWLHFTLAYRR